MRTALVSIANNEDHYIDEWIAYYLKLGFDDIFIYQNNWRANIKEKDNPRIHLIEFDGECKQVESYHNFMIHQSAPFDFAAFFDIDEFLVLKRWDSFTIGNELGHYQDVDIVSVPWRCFGDNGYKDIPKEGGSWSLIDRFTMGRDIYEPLKKCILNLRKLGHKAEFIDPHYLKDLSAIDPARSCVVSHSTFPESINDHWQSMELFHYKAKTLPEFVEKALGGDVYYGGRNWQHGHMSTTEEPTMAEFEGVHRSLCDSWNKELHFEAYNFFHDSHRCERRFDVALITDKSRLPHTRACIASMVETTTVPLFVHVVSDGLDASERASLESLRTVKNVLIEVVDADRRLLDGYVGQQRVSSSTLLKLSLPSIFPTVDTLLLLDCDIIVKKCLGPLFQTDIANCYAAVVKDYDANRIWRDKALVGGSSSSHFNTGQMLLNLKLMRKDSIEERLRDVRQQSRLSDQYVVNNVLGARVEFLPPKYFVSFGKILDERRSEYLDIGGINRFYGTGYKTIDELVSDAVICHYCGSEEAVMQGNAVSSEYRRCTEMANRMFIR